MIIPNHHLLFSVIGLGQGQGCLIFNPLLPSDLIPSCDVKCYISARASNRTLLLGAGIKPLLLRSSTVKYLILFSSSFPFPLILHPLKLQITRAVTLKKKKKKKSSLNNSHIVPPVIFSLYDVIYRDQTAPTMSKHLANISF